MLPVTFVWDAIFLPTGKKISKITEEREENNMAKKLSGFFKPDPNLSKDDAKKALKCSIMERLREMGVFDEDESDDTDENSQSSSQ